VFPGDSNVNQQTWESNQIMRTTVKMAVGSLVIGLLGVAQTRATNWVIGYPWGPTQNGSAYMQASQCQPNEGGYIFTAQKSSEHSGYSYISGTVYDSSGYTVNSSGHGVEAYISAPTETGAWPAFWLTTQGAWTGEMDVAEWKGNGNATQNTYSANGTWQTTSHAANNTYFEVETYQKNSTDATVYYYINGSWTATHTGGGFMGKTFWIIFDLQTGGSSGTPTFTSCKMSFDGYGRW
jgi:hypothetical protein